MQRQVKHVVLISLLLILIVTLFPYNFSLTEEWSITEISKSFEHVTNFQDLLVNILLFIPFGFGCTWLIHLKGFRGIKVILAVLGISVSLSTIVEVLQIFLSHRFSSKSDIFANSLGGFLGCLSFLLFYFYLSVSLTRLRKVLNPRHLALCLISYFTITIWITIPLLNATSLGNWNTDFPLILGNEATGDRPWQGYVAQLSIFDRAFSVGDVQQFLTERDFALNSRDSLLASYLFSGQRSYQERTSPLPVLAWQGQSSSYQGENQGERGVSLTHSHWLATPVAPTLMTERIRQTSQFTLCATIATDELKQTGPARIISLSSDPYHRNFMLGQQDNDLIFRLRTPLTGENGIKFNFIVPNVFTDTNYYRIAISYSNSILKIYIDELNNFYSWQLMPEAALFDKLFTTHFNYEGEGMLGYKILYYLLVFVPLGSLLALLSLTLRVRLIFCSLLIGVGVVFLAGVLQSLLASGNKTNLNLTSFLLSITITFITVLIVRAGISFRILSKLKSAQ